MAKKLWGGRFGKKTDPLVEEFTKSIDYDQRLAKYDVLGSLVHVSILAKSGLVDKKDARKIAKALNEIYAKIESGKFKTDLSSEDIHTNIQNEVEKIAGEAALKLHTARSRNDQVLLDLKLFSIAELSNVEGLCMKLKDSLKKASSLAKGIIIPGYTHLQHAHLVYLADHLAGYQEMLKRDEKRLKAIKDSIELFFGSGAMAGTPIKASLYFKKANGINIKPPKNSIDTISDRDFVIEILSALAILGMHLSRLSEDLIIWSTKEFGFVEIDDAFATGSSLMPQKKNPDVLELIRGYAGMLYGNLVSVLTMMKGLPLTYNRDMQLDKPPLFSSLEIITKELKVLPGLITTLKWNKKAIKKEIEDNEALYAADIMYHLVKKGIPFKKAHGIVGKLVKYSIDSGKKIKEMTDNALGKFCDKLKHKELVKLMDPATSVKSRISVKRSKK